MLPAALGEVETVGPVHGEDGSQHIDDDEKTRQIHGHPEQNQNPSNDFGYDGEHGRKGRSGDVHALKAADRGPEVHHLGQPVVQQNGGKRESQDEECDIRIEREIAAA